MNILGIGTCTEITDVALITGGKLSAKRRSQAGRQQLTILMPYISSVLKDASLNIKDIDLLAVTNGPGSFTGIRLGVTTAKTLAHINNIPIAPINTISAVAMGYPDDGIIISSLDARKSEVFFGVFKKTGEKLELIEGYYKSGMDEYINFINLGPYKNPVITGSIFWRYADKMQNDIKIPHKTVPQEYWTPRGEIIALMGKQLYDSGKTIDYNYLKPEYMRQWEATPPKPLI